jgi:hypothetical protein
MNTALQHDETLAEVCKLLESGNAPDPVLMRKVDSEAEAIREELRARVGTIELAVDLVREARTRP